MGTHLHADEIPQVMEPVRPSVATEMAGPPRIVLNVGCGYPLRQRLHPTFQGSEWLEIRHDVDPAAVRTSVYTVYMLRPHETR
jgi:hypothetical protein